MIPNQWMIRLKWGRAHFFKGVLEPPLPTIIWIELRMNYRVIWMDCEGYGLGGTYRWEWWWQICMVGGGYVIVFEIVGGLELSR